MQFPIKNISELESISDAVRWQYFEKLVAFIFEQNGFDAKQNVIVKDGLQKRQFDVIAKRYEITYLIECKKWKSRKQKQAALKSAVVKHLERCTLYAALSLVNDVRSTSVVFESAGGKNLKGNGKNLNEAGGKNFAAEMVEKHGAEIPLIVTLLEEDIMEHEGVVIVPIMKLNWFINNYDLI